MNSLENRKSRTPRPRRTASARSTFTYAIGDSRMRTVATERKEKGGVVCLRCVDRAKVEAGLRDTRVRLTLPDIVLRLPNGSLDRAEVERVEKLTRGVHDAIAGGMRPAEALAFACRADSRSPGHSARPHQSSTPESAHAPSGASDSVEGSIDRPAPISLGEALQLMERADSTALYAPGESHRADAIRAMRTVVKHFGPDKSVEAITEWDLLEAFPRQLATEWLWVHDPELLDEAVRRGLQRWAERHREAEARVAKMQQNVGELHGERTSTRSGDTCADVDARKRKKRGTRGKLALRPKRASSTPLTKEGGGHRWTEVCVNLVYRVANWLRKQQRLPPHTLVPATNWRADLARNWRKWVKNVSAGPTDNVSKIYSFDELARMHQNLHLAEPRLALMIVLAVGYRMEQVARMRWSHLRNAAGDGHFELLEVPGSGRKLGDQVPLTPQMRSALQRATNDGVLRELESARRRGDIADYPLFPAGKLRAGARAFRLGKTVGPIAPRTILLWLREFEVAAGVEAVAGRGTRGLRRLIAELASRYSTDANVQNVFSGTSAAMRDSVYRDARRRHTLEAAQEAHERFERDLGSGNDPMKRPAESVSPTTPRVEQGLDRDPSAPPVPTGRLT